MGDGYNFQQLKAAILALSRASDWEVAKKEWRLVEISADSDEAGHAFQPEAGHLFRFEAGRDSDLMSATRRVLPRIETMMFDARGLVKLGYIFG